MSSLLPVTPTYGPLDFDEEPYRKDYEDRFATEDGSYDDYMPAYRHGHESAADERYAGRAWGDAEGDLRSDWESRHPDSPWQHFKDAIQHAWERVKS